MIIAMLKKTEEKINKMDEKVECLNWRIKFIKKSSEKESSHKNPNFQLLLKN